MKDPNRESAEKLAQNMVRALSLGEPPADIRQRLYQDLAPHCFPGSNFTPEQRVRWGKHLIYWCNQWVGCGMPHVVADHRLVASMMATEIPSEFAGHVRPPWRAFMITVPSGVLGEGELSIVVDADHREAVTRGDLTRIIFVDRYQSEDGHGSMPWNLCEEWATFGTWDHTKLYTSNRMDGALPPSSMPGERLRRLQLVLRFIFGACAELHNRAITGSGASIAPPTSEKRRGGLPALWTVRLSRPVKVDARQYVREYVSGTRGGINVQYMRRGHWRNQPHGPLSSLRKFIHIEPHWVGPEDAPIAVRPHILTRSGEAE